MRRFSISELRAIRDPQYEFIDHGVDYVQYFIPVGTSFSDWTIAYVGVGSCAYEAAEDAIESAAVDTMCVDSIENPYQPQQEPTDMPEDCWYYITLRLR